MGAIHEEKANRVSISGCNQEFGSGTSNTTDSARGLSRGKTSNRICDVVGSDEGGGITSRQESMGSSHGTSAGRIRANNGNTAGTSSVHRQEVGRGRKKEKGKQGMKSAVVANQKGGVGKSATVVHLAFDFQERGKKVAVIDLDTQGNVSYTLDQFCVEGVTASSFVSGGSINITNANESGIHLFKADSALANMEKMSLADAGQNLKKGLASLESQGFDICLIDTAPSLGVSLAAALFASDYVISPIEPEVYSIQGIKKMNAVISNMRKVNPTLSFLGMFPSKVDNRKPRHRRNLEALQNAFPQLMIPHTVGERDSIAEACAIGTPVWGIKKSAARVAAKEVRALAEYVFNKMEITA